MRRHAGAGRGAPRPPGRALLLAVGIAGAALAALALPATGARLAELVARPAMDRVTAGGGLAPEGYRRMLAASDRALAWLAEPRLQRELGTVLAVLATAESELSVGQVSLLQEARDGLSAALAEAPADPIAWLRLAQLDATLLDLARAAAALRASQATGPVAPEIGVERAALALGLWAWLAEPVRERARGELAAAFRTEPATLARIAATTGRLDELRREIAADPAAVAALERELEALRRSASRPRGDAG